MDNVLFKRNKVMPGAVEICMSNFAYVTVKYLKLIDMVFALIFELSKKLKIYFEFPQSRHQALKIKVIE